MANAYFLHAADLHLGAQLKSLGSNIPEEKAEHIRKEVRRVFDDLVNVAIERRVDFVVLAGDVYDHAENDPGAQLRVNAGFRRLADAGIKVFMVHGNHDPLQVKQKANVRDLPGNVTVFQPGDPQTYEVTMSNGVMCTVAGVSFAKAAETENLARRFSGLSGSPLVAVLHANVGGSKDHDDYAPCSPADLANTSVNYWALGHIHMRSVNGQENKWWVYPGNLQGRSTKNAECGPKGVMVVPVSDSGRVLAPEFVECDRARFERVRLDVSHCGNSEEVLNAAESAVSELVGNTGGKPLVLRLEVTGATAAHTALKDEKVFEELQERTEEVMGLGHITKVVDTTYLPVDLGAVRQSTTVAGYALQEVQKVRDGNLELPGLEDVHRSVRLAMEDESLRADILNDAERLLVDSLWSAR